MKHGSEAAGGSGKLSVGMGAACSKQGRETHPAGAPASNSQRQRTWGHSSGTRGSRICPRLGCSPVMICGTVGCQRGRVLSFRERVEALRVPSTAPPWMACSTLAGWPARIRGLASPPTAPRPGCTRQGGEGSRGASAAPHCQAAFMACSAAWVAPGGRLPPPRSTPPRSAGSQGSINARLYISTAAVQLWPPSSTSGATLRERPGVSDGGGGGGASQVAAALKAALRQAAATCCIHAAANCIRPSRFSGRAGH